MKEKHLEFIQGIINRMGSNSFALKGLSVTIVTAIIGVSLSSNASPRLTFLALLPTIVFWALDAYYLWQEKLFRELYKSAINSKKNSFSLDTTPYKKSVEPWPCVMFSLTLGFFYGTLIAVIVIVGLW